MNKFYAFLLIAFIGFFNSCNRDDDNLAIESLDYQSISITKKSLTDLMKVGKISRTVKLDANSESIIGSVDYAIVDKNGDIYVGDFDSGKKVLRFNKEGKFLNGFGRPGQGPGEYGYLKKFDISTKNEIFLISYDKLLTFKKTGELLNELRLPYTPIDVKVVNDSIFLYVIGYRNREGEKNSIVVLNSDLTQVGGLSDFDTRLLKYKFLSINQMGKFGENLFFIDIYDLALTIYSVKEKRLIRLKIPNENYQLDEIWKKSHFIETDRDEIAKRIHRFELIYAMDEKLFLWEHWQLKGIYDYWLLDLKKRKALVLTYPGPEYFKENLFFDRIVGGYDKGIICVYDDVEKFNKHKNEFPILKDVSFSMEDNPILVFFEFNEL